MSFYIYLYILYFLIYTFIYLIIQSRLLGNTLRNKFNIFIQNSEVKFTFYLFIFVSIISYLSMAGGVIYCLDDETNKALANVEGNNVNIHNPNIILPNSLSKAVTSLGVGGAIAAGITTTGALMKSGTPLGVKLGATAVGGAIGGALFVSINYMNTIAQKRAEYNSGKELTLCKYLPRGFLCQCQCRYR
jgi:hypothetical protein